MTDQIYPCRVPPPTLSTTKPHSTSSPTLRLPLKDTQPRSPFDSYPSRDAMSGNGSLDRLTNSSLPRPRSSLSHVTTPDKYGIESSHEGTSSVPKSKGSRLALGVGTSRLHSSMSMPGTGYDKENKQPRAAKSSSSLNPFWSSFGSAPRASSALSTPDTNDKKGLYPDPEAARSTSSLSRIKSRLQPGVRSHSSLSTPSNNGIYRHADAARSTSNLPRPSFSGLRKKTSTQSLQPSSQQRDIWEEEASETGTPSMSNRRAFFDFAVVTNSERSLLDRIRRRNKEGLAKVSAQVGLMPLGLNDPLARTPSTPQSPRSSMEFRNRWATRRENSLSEIGSPQDSLASLPEYDDELPQPSQSAIRRQEREYDFNHHRPRASIELRNKWAARRAGSNTSVGSPVNLHASPPGSEYGHGFQRRPYSSIDFRNREHERMSNVGSPLQSPSAHDLHASPTASEYGYSFQQRPHSSMDVWSRGYARQSGISNVGSPRESLASPVAVDYEFHRRPHSSVDLHARRMANEAARTSTPELVVSPSSSDTEFEFVEPDCTSASPREILERAKARQSMDGISVVSSPSVSSPPYNGENVRKSTSSTPGPKPRVIRSRDLLELSLSPSKVYEARVTTCGALVNMAARESVSPEAKSADQVIPSHGIFITPSEENVPEKSMTVKQDLTLLPVAEIFSQQAAPINHHLALTPAFEILSREPKAPDHKLSLMPLHEAFVQKPEPAKHNLSLISAKEIYNQEPNPANHNLSLAPISKNLSHKPMPANHNLSITLPTAMFTQSPISPVFQPLSLSTISSTSTEPIPVRKTSALSTQALLNSAVFVTFICIFPPVLSFLLEHYGEDIADDLVGKLELGVFIAVGLNIAFCIFGGIMAVVFGGKKL